MTFRSMYNDMMIACLLLVAGYIARERISIFRKLYLPSSVVAGLIGLVLGPQVLKLVTLPESISTYSSVLVDMICTSVVWGVVVNRSKVKSYIDFVCLLNCAYWSQLFYGGLIGILLIKVWPSLPKAWGTELIFSFASGHGTAISMGKVYEGYGITGNAEIGAVMATIGLMVAMIVGMSMVNLGIRRGWAKFMRKTDSNGRAVAVSAEAGYVPEEKQASIGTTKVYSSSINNLLFQFAILMSLQYVGGIILGFAGRFIPLINDIPSFANGIIAAVIVYPVIDKMGLSKYVDRQTTSTIGSFCVDIMIVGAIASLDLAFVATNAVPLVIICAVATTLNVLFTFAYSYLTCKDEWFEKACFVYGQSTGVVATGWALYRALDPENKATLPEIQGVGQAVSTPFIYTIFALIPAMAATKPGTEVVLGLGLFLAFAVFGFLFRQTKGMKLTPFR